MPDIFAEGARQFTVCNACRYCEGFCPVWQVMETRTTFGKGDLYYLANICHDCKACYYACPYTEPNELKINIPKILSELRLESYREYATPKLFSAFFERHKRYFLATVLLSLLATMLSTFLFGNPFRLVQAHLEAGSFYNIFPHLFIIVVGLGVGLYVVANYLNGVWRFYRDVGVRVAHVGLSSILGGAADVLWHNGFRGGWRRKGSKAGCYHETTKPSYVFLTLHALIFYGFISALISTILAAIYQDALGILPPYTLLSLPVLFGIAGGVSMILGTLSFFALELREDARPIFKGMSTLDYAFLLTLAIASITGFLTLAFRSTSLMGVMFTVHMGFVLVLFVTAPYGKFVHFTYRYLALVLARMEEALELQSTNPN